MQFQVPQFIEHEAKILGPLTFRQTIFMGIAAMVCFMLYFAFGKTNFFLFILSSILIVGGTAALAFVKISGQTLSLIVKNFFIFSLAPKLYLWKRKETAVYFEKSPIKPVGKEEPKNSPLKIVKGSNIKDLSKKLDFGG
ncbi:MAG: PrgI family protein [Candidatus Paceibacterota bacterium]|jgi:hypothetical protein